MTHAELVQLAAKWLRSEGHNPVFTEPVDSPECPDAIGFRDVLRTTVVECKVSEGDFKADAEKLHRRGLRPAMGMFRYYLVPEFLIETFQVPEGYGLLYADGQGVRVVQESVEFGARGRAFRDEAALLLHALRRLQKEAHREADEARPRNQAKLRKDQQAEVVAYITEHGEAEAKEIARIISRRGRNVGTVANWIVHDVKRGLIEGLHAEGVPAVIRQAAEVARGS